MEKKGNLVKMIKDKPLFANPSLELPAPATPSPRAIRQRVALLLLLLHFFLLPPSAAEAGVKFVFLFIGDGMGAAQRNAAETYLAGERRLRGDETEREAQLAMNALPVQGAIRTNSLSGITDSAAAGTALATGHKTHNGAIGMNPKNGTKYPSIARIAQKRGMKVGIVTSAFLHDATPAAFYGHAEKRTMRETLIAQLTESGFDFFGGGGFKKPAAANKKSPAPRELATARGYRIADTEAAIRGLKPGGKVIAIHPGVSAAYMPWAIDTGESGLSLADFTAKGIELLESDAGFFLMIEGGKIDLACHANDAGSAIREVIAFDRAIERALGFLAAHPLETLIVVTSDHETGGMTMSASPDEATAFYRAFSAQKGSYAAFERTVSPRGEAAYDKLLSRARAFFGAGLPSTQALREAFSVSMTPKDKRPTKDKAYKSRYATYDPFTVTSLREMNRAAGVTWTTFYHTGRDVPVSAIGAGAEAFGGEYENTEIFHKLEAAIEG